MFAFNIEVMIIQQACDQIQLSFNPNILLQLIILLFFSFLLVLIINLSSIVVFCLFVIDSETIAILPVYSQSSGIFEGKIVVIVFAE